MKTSKHCKRSLSKLKFSIAFTFAQNRRDGTIQVDDMPHAEWFLKSHFVKSGLKELKDIGCKYQGLADSWKNKVLVISLKH